MKYNFNIVLSGEMEAKFQGELVDKIQMIIDDNPIFQELKKVFDIRLDKQSIEGQDDDTVLDQIAKDFNLHFEERKGVDYFGETYHKECLIHTIGKDPNGGEDNA